MNYITRSLQQALEQRLFRGKALIVTGARQVGKSTLLKEVARKTNERVLFLDCDEPEVRSTLRSIQT